MTEKDNLIGVLYVLHGGMDTYNPQYLWDASVQMFSYDHNHPVYHMVIWNPDAWSMVLQTEFAVKRGHAARVIENNDYETVHGTLLSKPESQLVAPDANGVQFLYEQDSAEI